LSLSAATNSSTSRALTPFRRINGRRVYNVRINRKGPGKESAPDLGAHLGQQSQTHGAPSFAAGKFDGDLRHTHLAGVLELIDEGRLLQNFTK